MKDRENKEHVLSVRITEADYRKLEKIAEWNAMSVQETARKGLEMIISAHQGQLEKK